MSTVSLEPFFSYSFRTPKFTLNSRRSQISSLNYTPSLSKYGGETLSFSLSSSNYKSLPQASSSTDTAVAVVETSEASDVVFRETYQIKRPVKVDGKISIRLDKGEDEENWQLIVGCSLPGKWILHWGVNYVADTGSEWDQPPVEIRPPGSNPFKDYAVETPLQTSSTILDGEMLHQVKIDFNTNSLITAINFVLKDEETGAWYQHRGRDFKVPLIGYVDKDGNITKESIEILQEGSGQASNGNNLKGEQKRCLEGFYEEHKTMKETLVDNSVTVSVTHSQEKDKNLVLIETDVPGDVVVHWGICKDEYKKWEIPDEPYPPQTNLFRNKALRTLLQQKVDGHGCQGSFTLGTDDDVTGLVFVLKVNETTWLNCLGNDFYIPLSNLKVQNSQSLEAKEEVSSDTDDIINEIRSLVGEISSRKSKTTKNKDAQESILHEIEKLAAEAYSIFRSNITVIPEAALLEADVLKEPLKIRSGTGSGFEILCQGFNWESHKSGKWYLELLEKASEFSSIGITVLWLPPPTDSVSPEGYMPRDLYNLNSRYGNIEELKTVVKKFHEAGIRVLGDVVLNHRCAEHQNENGVWNIFGGRLNWDNRAVVSDDPHFQGRGNKSSGDNFHAAPNIDHSQEFVRKDIKEWLGWLRKEIGYDGWRLDFVRGFWGGYVKDYLDATEPYFVVGEYWDSLIYTYGEMDYNQDAHRQRIIDWINATNGTAGAFDVTTKGILHSVLERCEYWRLTDEKGKPPGVLGWWPSRAITFIENHDTGSTQGHWRFPGGKELQGYAYILTHPGTPSVFYDHLFSNYRHELEKLISIRNKNMINCRSTVKITKADKDVYAAIIDEKVAMKIGPGYYEPSNENQRWSVAIEGNDYKIWEASDK